MARRIIAIFHSFGIPDHFGPCAFGVQLRETLDAEIAWARRQGERFYIEWLDTSEAAK